MMKTSLAVEKPRPQTGIVPWLPKLRTFPTQPVLVGVTLAAIVALAYLSSILLPMNASLNAAGHDIVAYELAFTADNANQALRDWGPAGQKLMSDSLYLDFPFLLSYGLAFSGLTLILGRALTGRLGTLGIALAPAGLTAALFDAVENLILFTTLGLAAVSPIQPLAAGICASLKFFLWVVTFVYLVTGGVVWVVQKVKGRRA